MRISLVLLISFLVSACGGSSGGGNSAQLAEIAGVWDSSVTYGNVVDEIYTVINEDGTATEYDYLGDSFDDFANCYEKTDFTLTYLGGDEFRATGPDGITFTFNASASGDTLTLRAGSQTIDVTRSALIESDFQPICE